MCVLVATRVDEFRRQKAVLADGATGVIVFSAVNSSDDVYGRRFETFADDTFIEVTRHDNSRWLSVPGYEEGARSHVAASANASGRIPGCWMRPLSPGQTLGHWCQSTLGHPRHVRH